MTNPHDRQDEIDRNLAFFIQQLPSIPPELAGKFAIIRHQEIIGYYDTAADAISSATKLYQDGIYSIQQVTGSAVNLGFYSHAVPLAST